MSVVTLSGTIRLLDSGGEGMPALLIHGNSFCKEVFSKQLAAAADERVRLIAVDLPGHGESSDATDPECTYSISGYARACREVVDALRIDRVALLGWSLGGHVALELARQDPRVAGLMIVGAPPFAQGFFGMMRAFQTRPALYLATKRHLSPAEIRLFARACLGGPVDAFLAAKIARTDPRARPQLLKSMMERDGADQKLVAESLAAPLAVLNGSREPVARLRYVNSLTYANLWRGRCHVLEGAGHAPFLEAPDAFNRLFFAFLHDLSNRKIYEGLPRGRALLRSA